MIEIVIMLLSVTAIVCILYPIRPRYRNKEKFYSRDSSIPVDAPNGLDPGGQKIFRDLVSTQNQLKEDSRYDTISPEQENL